MNQALYAHMNNKRKMKKKVSANKSLERPGRDQAQYSGLLPGKILSSPSLLYYYDLHGDHCKPIHEEMEV
jgi:hypothetical protein